MKKQEWKKSETVKDWVFGLVGQTRNRDKGGGGPNLPHPANLVATFTPSLAHRYTLKGC